MEGDPREEHSTDEEIDTMERMGKLLVDFFFCSGGPAAVMWTVVYLLLDTLLLVLCATLGEAGEFDRSR